MTTDNLYGVASTDDVEFDKAGLPLGTYKAMIIGEEADKKGRGVVVEFEVLEGANKGETGKVWLLTLADKVDSSEKATITANIAKQKLKRIAEATGKAVTPATPLKQRVLTIEVVPQKGNPEYTEIKRYLPENHSSEAAPF